VTVRAAVELPFHKAPALPGWNTTVVSFASDLPLLGDWGVGYQMGPGSIKVAHTEREYILKQDLLEGVGLYVRLVRELVRQGEQGNRRTGERES
jgi:acetylornithine deacetylase